MPCIRSDSVILTRLSAAITPEAAKQNNNDPASNTYLPEVTGALVLDVRPDTPATKAGVKKFDVILSIGDKQIRTPADAQAIVDSSKIGERLVAKVARGDKTLTVTFVTEDLSQLPSKDSPGR